MPDSGLPRTRWRRWRRALLHVENGMFMRSRYSQPLLVAMSLSGCAAFLLYYPLWSYLVPQRYENLWLRMACVAMLLPITVQKHWPRRCRPWLPTYWYAAVTFVLPFFVGYMTLRNQGSTPWLLTHLAAIFLTMMMFDLISFAVIVLIGSLAAGVVFLLGPHQPLPLHVLVDYLPVLLLTMGLGPMASLSQKFADQARVNALARASNNIAHELRTPLGSLQIAGMAFRRYLPDLVQSHLLAKEAGLPVTELRGAHLQALEQGVDTIEQEVSHAHMVIDMLLMSARPLDRPVMNPVSVRDSIRQALQRYPFGSRAERERVHLAGQDDFIIKGSETLLMHVIFNLLRNALQHISAAGKGDIRITIDSRQPRHVIRVRDTGPGIPPDVLPRIFNRFFSYNPNHRGVAGLGIGLAFTREAVEQMGGLIHCRSRWGEFTEFTVSFPALRKDERT